MTTNCKNIENKVITTKRRRSSTSESYDRHSQELFWPDSDDNDSFFSNSKIENLIDNKVGTFNERKSNINDFEHNCIDDSLFGDINIPESENGNLGGTPLVQDFPDRINNSDVIFSDIDINDYIQDSEKDLFSDSLPDDFAIQNTQKFLEDVAFKVPNIPNQKNKHIPNDDSMISVSMLEDIQGSQYETSEEIRNRTIQSNQCANSSHKEIADLSHLNWETQIFVEEKNDIPSKGNFYGLPDSVKKMILEHKSITGLYEWQDECLNLPAIRQRKNLIYALPTSGGKTLVAEILMLREIICREKNVLFILPYVSIVQEKVSAMSPFAISLNFIVDEYTSGKGKCPPSKRIKRKSIYIASIEKGAILLDSLIDAGRANEIGLVVVDELHLIGEKGRGSVLETMLTKVMFINAKIQVVGMSATIGNLTEISTFLNADVYSRGFRPVELKEYIKCGRDILQINAAGKTLEEVFTFKRSVNFKYTESVARCDPDHLAGLVTECAPKHCCLIFCPTRKNCENVALLLTQILPKSRFLEHQKSEKNDLMDALEKICGILSPVLAKTIPFGVAYHHSGLTTDERKFIETAYRLNVISVICCTSTLAAGVNLPAKRVIIRAPYIGAEFMTLCKYKQMVGRAGRAGMGEAGESILISACQDNVRVGEMLFSPMDKAVSSLDNIDGLGIQSLIVSSIGLNLAHCRRDLYQLLNSTLLAVQAEQLGLKTETLVMNSIREMFKNRILEICSREKSEQASIIISQDIRNDMKSITTQERRLFIGKSTKFQLTTIGKASFKAGIDYKRTYNIYYELKNAQKHLILTNYAHLLYLVVCFNSNATGDELFAANAAILFREYTSLDDTTQKLFQLVGLTEAIAAKIRKTLSIQGKMELKLNRLFKVLILIDILNLLPIPAIATKFDIERGSLQNLVSQSTAAANAIVRLCEQVEEFWCYKPLFERIGAKMDRCGTIELEPLMELPAVKINRAKQFYAAGFKTIEDIAKCRPMQLVKSIEHMPLKVAKEIISAAKIILMKKLDVLEDETEAIKLCLHQTEEPE
ncbi:helicase POLQ-like [Teleopsis dalmanni]|uniref:helicase POLQ-like n=1 Tax=Teleopsis dalmanni TaxID=139649 RepID=UPI0018CDC19B|nr:helicase POLQ-like [Teleopsis dalmanni]